MQLTKKLIADRLFNQETAIYAYRKFIEVVLAKIESLGGVEIVLEFDRRNKLYWVKEQYERILIFAEQTQMKLIPTQLQGTGEDGEFILKVEIAEPKFENNPTSESGNRIQQYFEV